MSPDDIRDIRGPIAIPYWWIPLAVAAGVALVLAATYAIYRYVKRANQARAKTPVEIALERIERAKSLLTTASSAAFSSEVSDAVRAYVEARFDLRATRQTTEEFLHGLLGGGAGPLATHRAELEAFLGQCDLAKFARLTLTLGDGETLAESARAFVLATARPPTGPGAATSTPPSSTLLEGARA